MDVDTVVDVDVYVMAAVGFALLGTNSDSKMDNRRLLVSLRYPSKSIARVYHTYPVLERFWVPVKPETT
jgi:hypothetical protein